MNFNFDAFNQVEKPTLVLCNPNKEEIFAIGAAYNIALKIKFNALSSLTFDVPAQTDKNVPVDYYDFLQAKRLVFIQDIGYFIIITVEEDLNGMTPIKSVTCNSLEAELIYKKVTVFNGTFQFYNPISPTNTLLGQMLALIPTWNAGFVDGALLPIFRTFTINDKTVYDFLMNDVATAYQCVFIFDTVAKTISAYSTTNATTNTDIFLSFDNLLKSGKLSELTDELVTTLRVYGAGDLDIHRVNPLGTASIYNFDYFKTIDWMSQGLIDAITAWENNFAIQQPIFANLLTQLANANDQLLVYEGQLDDLNTQLAVQVDLQRVRIQQVLSYADINAQIAILNGQITSQNALITNQNITITNIQTSLNNINQTLIFSSAFSPTQLLELNTFIIESTYQNNNFLTTDSMTNSDVQNQSQQLYNQALDVLNKVSQPRYEITIDSTNFIFLQEFKPFTDQLQLGCIVTVKKDDNAGHLLNLVLLELDFQYDDPTKFTIVMSNRLRLDASGGFTYSDLFNQAVNAGTSVNFNSPLWSNWNDSHKDDVTTFISSALNTANNELISSNNQEIIINKSGLRGKNFDPNTQTYSGDQVWLVNNMLAFSNDGFQSAQLALGRITVGSNSTFGLVADTIVGRLLAGNNLTITNQNNSFTVDGNGATLVNANFSLIGNSGKNKILLDTTNGIKIQSLVNSQFVDKFYVDTSGNVTFAGVLNGASGTFSGALAAQSGTIGGWTITTTGITSPANGNFINSNGNFKLGPLTVTGNTGTFTGSFSASQLSGQIVGNQIANNTITAANVHDINANTINAGTINGINIFGSLISGATISGAIIEWPGVIMQGTSTGASVIQADNNLSLNAGFNDGISISTSNPHIVMGRSVYIGGTLQINGNIFVNGGTGLTIVQGITISGHTLYLYFSQGILYNVITT